MCQELVKHKKVNRNIKVLAHRELICSTFQDSEKSQDVEDLNGTHRTEGQTFTVYHFIFLRLGIPPLEQVGE